MGLLKSFASFLDEDSSQSFEKKLDNILGQVEQTLVTTLDKAENGINKVDRAINRIDDVAQKSEAAIDKVDNSNKKIIDVVTKKPANNDKADK